MITSANALIPVLALILVGFVIQRTGFLPPDRWRPRQHGRDLHGTQTCLYFVTLPLTIWLLN